MITFEQIKKYNLIQCFKQNGYYYKLEGVSNKECKKHKEKISIKIEGIKKTKYAIYSV